MIYTILILVSMCCSVLFILNSHANNQKDLDEEALGLNEKRCFRKVILATLVGILGMLITTLDF